MLVAMRHSLLSARVRTAPCCSYSSKTADRKGKEVKYPPIVPPYYRKARPVREGLNILQKQFPNLGDRTGDGPRLHDYKSMGEMAAAMPTVKEKVDFVSPYERPWKKFERTWHRVFHPPLLVPRKAWVVEPVTRGYDTLHFYEYITKTKTEKGIDAWHKDLRPPTAAFEKKLKETLASKLKSHSTATPADRVAFSNILLQHLLEDALHSVTSDHLQKARVSFAPRCESFWVRGGFKDVCGYENPYTDDELHKYNRGRPRRFTGDDRRRLGELAFVCRDSFAAQVRTTNPLQAISDVNWEQDSSSSSSRDRDGALISKEEGEDRGLEEVEEKKSDAATYTPKAMGMWADAEPLWMAPGYEMDSGEQHRFGLVGLRDASAIEDRCAYWGITNDEPDAEVRNEMYLAMAVASLFSWLNGQAHALGFTQYNDLTYPLVSQLILSDGKAFFFAVGQLNTLAININVNGFVNNRFNRCWFEGPYNLYDTIDDEGTFWHADGQAEPVEGLNPRVLSRILKMLLLTPVPDTDLIGRDLTPFIPKRVERDESDSDVFNMLKGRA